MNENATESKPDEVVEYVQPTKDAIAAKLAEFSRGESPNWDGFVSWVDQQIDEANTAGYSEGYDDGYNECVVENAEKNADNDD